MGKWQAVTLGACVDECVSFNNKLPLLVPATARLRAHSATPIHDEPA